MAPPPIKIPGATSSSPFNKRFGINGSQKPNEIYVGNAFSGSAAGTKPFWNIDVVKGNYAMLTPEATNKLAKDLNAFAGGYGPQPMQNLPGFWEKMVDISYQAQTQFGERVTPLEAFDWYKKKFNTGNFAAGSASGGGGGGGGGGPAAPTKRVNLTNPDTANQLVDAALEQYLGRKANAKEQETFRKSLRKAEMRNPVSAEIQGDTAVTKGGIDPGARAEEFAQAQEGAAEYQASTTYLNAFIEGIRNPVGI
jgi:hypothetical protein